MLQTEHFDIYYYPEEEAATRLAARMAERWYARLSQLLEHSLSRRQPLVLYASHPHFSQTNVTPISPSEGTGGLTERIKARIAMPFAAGLGETDHVLGHEIAHAFQIDVIKTTGQDAYALPGWFIEGMAEYLSLGPDNTHTAMWLRDAAVNDALPTLEQLEKPNFFPYRYGHALWSHLASRHGDGIIGRALRSRERRPLSKIEEVAGADAETISREWHEAIEAAAVTGASDTDGHARLGGTDDDSTRLYLAPALSPDGRQLTFISERDRLSLGVFMTDAATGRVTRRIVSTATDPHFDSLQYIHSSGAWDAAGRRFAMIAVSDGEPVLVIIDTADDDRRTEIPLETVGEAYNPSWSPDGDQIVFSALHGGLSDLFIYTLETGAVQQLTADVWADFHPAWSPDGRSIALATDRFTSNLDDLQFGPLQVAMLDLESGVIRPLYSEDQRSKQVSPQWAPDGRTLYFISDRAGTSDIYRFNLGTGQLRQLTQVVGGVSGITSTSPALAVAAREGTLAFSVYRKGRYEIQLLDPESGAGREPRAASLHPLPGEGIAAMLADPRAGLPAAQEYPSSAYADRLRLETFLPPFIGAAAGGSGGLIRASFGVSFADVLRDRQLQALLRVGTDADDLAAQVAYINQKGQWNWGVLAGSAPSRFAGARRSLDYDGVIARRETANLKYSNQWAGLVGRYHLSRTQRFEFGLTARRTGFEWQTFTRVVDIAQRATVSEEETERAGDAPVFVGELTAAFVHDTVVSGPVGPLLGQRFRFEVSPAVGGLKYAEVLVDARRYFMPVRPFTVAVRVQHNGRYGRDAGDPRLTPLVVGLETLVRGYNIRSFLIDQCGQAATSCSPLDELSGGRVALLNVELRAPLLGLFTGDLTYARVPIETIAFVDTGFLWTGSGSNTDRERFRSVSFGSRANVGGIVFEVTAARPFDRVGKGWTMSLLIRPGF